MRYLLFSDIHGNLEALRSILAAAKKEAVDTYIFLGDLVGYGASPNEVIQEIQTLKPLHIIRGNHDKAVSELDSIETFNPVAAAAIHWTRDNLSEENRKYLAQLPSGPKIINENLTLCHGSPADEDYYIFGEFDAAEAFMYTGTAITFFGHTHLPFVYTEEDRLVKGKFITSKNQKVKLQEKIRYLINPGSVGQPRDRKPDASYAVFDSDEKKVVFHRVPYDIKAAQEKITSVDLPRSLADRLEIGI
jgi:predicted phosphodiesterase